MVLTYDVIIIGAGPVGLAAAVEAKRKNLSYLVLDKGVLVNSIFHFPTFMRFFTEAYLLEIGDHPFPSTDIKPSRQQALDYYRRVAQIEDLNIKFHHTVIDIKKLEEFEISGKKVIRNKESDFEFISKYVIIATGYFDTPNGLGGIPGEDRKNVDLYFDEPHSYFRKDVVVIGAGNSGAEAALELYRHGANVTIVHNYPEPKPSLKYWVGPDLRNRIASKQIKSVMPAVTKSIDDRGVLVEHEGMEKLLPADHIFIFTGFTPNIKLFKKWGITINEDDSSCNLNDMFETNIQNLFVIGSAGFGTATNIVFIENGREHAKTVIQEIDTRIN